MSSVAEMALNPQVASKIKDIFDDKIAFNKFLGFELVELTSGSATIQVAYREEFVGDALKKILHGGVLCTLIDATGGAAAISALNFPKELTVNTVDLRVDFLRPAAGMLFRSVGKVVRKGGRIVFTDIYVYNDKDEMITRGMATYSIYKPAAQSDDSQTAKRAIIDLADD